ncbi:MAG: GTPase HflX [Planctomycetes bacterium]|nr:GTPase HflX [Planctomycetota bacterium]
MARTHGMDEPKARPHHPARAVTRDPNAPERAILAKVDLDRDAPGIDPLGELARLAETAGLAVVGRIIQRRPRPCAATFIGTGKAAELAQRAGDLAADVVVMDNDLTPAQARNLERIIGRKVIDRTELILDIFASHASSRQARIQVELAQLRYNLPRLRRMWTHLSRYEGGIGVRGPGEKQLESDRRIARRRIRALEEELRGIEGNKRTILAGRDGFSVALVGYTNAGKSTLLNRLTGANEGVADALFVTLDTRTRKWPLDRNRWVYLNDTVGFIRDLPRGLVASFHATLEETVHADLLIHVADATAPDARGEIEAVRRVLGALGCAAKPVVLALNKWDRLEERTELEARILANEEPGSIPISALTGFGLDRLAEAVRRRAEEGRQDRTLHFPTARGDLAAFLERSAEILHRSFEARETIFEVRIDPSSLHRFREMMRRAPYEG